MSQVIVFASFTPKEGAFAKAQEIIQGMVVPTRAEEGNQKYDFYVTTDGKSLHLFEIYADQAALEFHRGTEHYKAYRAVIVDYLAEPIGVKVLSGIDVAA